MKQQGTYKECTSSLPDFLGLSGFAALKLLSKEDFRIAPLRNMILAFENLGDAIEQRIAISTHNGDNFPPNDARYSPTSEKIGELEANLGFAYFDVVTEPSQTKIVRQVQAFSRDATEFEIDGTKRLIETVFPPSEISWLQAIPFGKAIFNGTEHNFCTENRILNYFANEIRPEQSPNGQIFLFTERFPCVSCREVINQFSESFPNVKLTVVFVYPKEITKTQKESLLEIGIDLVRVART